MVSVKKIMTKNPISVEMTTTAREVAEIMKSKKVGSLLVLQGDKTVGIITETDLVRRVLGEDRIPYITPCSQVMSAPVLTISPDASVYEAQDMMDKHHIRHLLVVDEEEAVLGLISIRDLIHPTYVGREDSWDGGVTE
ncbi:MAG: CBS domain-containing protein [Nitrospirae bacterium]|jgi:CBS domain-containing protein|uniref:Putative signal-transduction protein with CBS domains n=1 Tax=Leptospirillum ferrodiazotrophum TaxID=412449 RepID=C6HWA9_9BACT|nr:MAG: putative signal-transduction protein with CBS domains [Leptospirillum ferrodiazotrophum]MCL5953790.1 CBS domain-containing protein [Nitrospirota bacterium]